MLLKTRVLVLLFIPIVLMGCRSDKVVEGDTEVDIIPNPPEAPFFPGAFVCEAFQDEDPVTDIYQGLVGEIFYLSDDQPRYSSVVDFLQYSHRIEDVSLYFNTVHVPTRPFDRGFETSEGEVLTTLDGDTLYEYFGFRAHSDFVLAPGEASGLYEFATLTDDGSMLYFGDTLIVNNDGAHPTRMGCAPEPIYIEAGRRHPMRLDYFQGPRYHIAAMLFYRPFDPERPLDPECGREGNSRYFNSNHNPPTPTANYTGLLDRGWSPLGVENYRIPEGILNMCNFPAPVVSSIALASIGSSYAHFTFETDVPSLVKGFLTDLSTGEETSTNWSEDFYKNHRVEFQGLKPYTLYQFEILAVSPSGRETRTSAVTFRTRL